MRQERLDQVPWEDAVREALQIADLRCARWVRNATMAAASLHDDETETHAWFAGWLAVRALLESREPLDDALRMGWSVVERVRVLGGRAHAERARGLDPFESVCLRLCGEALLDLAEVEYYGRRRRRLARHWRCRVRAGRWIPAPAGTDGEERPGSVDGWDVRGDAAHARPPGAGAAGECVPRTPMRR